MKFWTINNEKLYNYSITQKGELVEIPVYISTDACACIGYVDIDTPDQFEDAAAALWKKKGYDIPSLCHQCATFDLGEWEIGDSHLDYYFKKKKE